MKTKPLPAAQCNDSTPLLLTRHEAAAKLAISLRTLDLQIANGNISVCRIGGAVRFRPTALDYFIEANEHRMSAKRRAAIRGTRKANP